MPVIWTFLRARQSLPALVVLTASGALIWFGGDFNMPIPGAEVPIILGTLAPLLNSWAVLSCADGAYQWIEDLAPRDMAAPRTAVLGGLTAASIGSILVAGTYSIGAATASALVCGFLILIGLGTIGWIASGRVGGFLLPLIFTLMCISLGTTTNAHSVARWALLLVEPGAPAALVAAVVGTVVAVAGWWTRDRVLLQAGRLHRSRRWPRVLRVWR